MPESLHSPPISLQLGELSDGAGPRVDGSVCTTTGSVCEGFTYSEMKFALRRSGQERRISDVAITIIVKQSFYKWHTPVPISVPKRAKVCHRTGQRFFVLRHLSFVIGDVPCPSKKETKGDKVGHGLDSISPLLPSPLFLHPRGCRGAFRSICGRRSGRRHRR